MMKKYLNPSFVRVFLLCSILIPGCNKKPELFDKPKGSLKLTVFTDNQDQMTVQTIRSVPLNQYYVAIYTTDGHIYLEYDHFDLVPAEIMLEEGGYYVVAHSGNDSIAAFENPYLFGQSDIFTIGSNRVTEVAVSCEIMNCGVKINYHDHVPSGFSNYYTVVKSGNDSLTFTQNENRAGYFRVNPLQIYSVLSYQLSNGSTAQKRVSGTIEAPQQAYLYNITIDATTNGLQTGIALTLNQNLDTIDISINDHLLVNDLETGNLLITEIMYDPSNLNDTEGEWFEIYNNTLSPVNLNHLVLSSAGNQHIINEEIILQPFSYYVMARADTACDVQKHVYSGITLLNTSDDLSLLTYGTDGTDGQVIATVTYDESGGFPAAVGASLNLSTSHFNFDEAQLPASWCLSTDTFNTGDYGTPGEGNRSCD